jgi:hypothetical protein
VLVPAPMLPPLPTLFHNPSGAAHM